MSSETDKSGLGDCINSSDLVVGLPELNKDITFDAAINRPSDYQYVLQGGDNMEAERGGVYYKGHYVCAMDRGMIPEWAMFSTREGWEPIRMCDIERYDDTKVIYIEIMPQDPFYHQALLKAQSKDDHFRLDEDGRVFRYDALRQTQVKDKALRVGWRHTLGKLIARRIPGITLKSLETKFGVRM